MVILVMIGCVVLYAFIHAGMKDAGVEPRSRGSLRYQRRKGRKLGIDSEYVDITPRQSAPIHEEGTITGSHVVDLKRGLYIFLLWVIGMILWAALCMRFDMDWFFPGMFGSVGVMYLYDLNKREKL